MVFETNGRPSDEAVAFVRAYGHGLSQEDRAEVVGTTWRQISRTLQIGNAEMVLSAVS
jgi:DNA-directed RNA polymerase specialized sigma24 family protein